MTTVEEKQAPLVNRLKTTSMVTQFVTDYYEDIRHAREQGRKVAWTCGPAPFELLRAMNVGFQHGESYGAYAAAKKGQVELKAAAAAEGYPIDACSYVRTINGLALRNLRNEAVRPDMWIPLPDFVVSTNPCHTMSFWNDSLGRLLKIPTLNIDVPTSGDKEAYERNLVYVTKQLERLIELMEEVTGQKFDWDNLNLIMRRLKRASELRREIMDMCKVRPSPMSFFDMLISLNPMHVLRGTAQSVQYFEALKVEVAERVANGVGVLNAGEKYRLYWDNLAIWQKLGVMSNKLAALGMNVICGNYTHGGFYPFPEKIDPDNPLRSIAHELVHTAYLFFSPNRIEFITELCKEFSIDGLLMHSARTCRPMDSGQYDIMYAIEKRLGIPAVMIDADPTDPDFWSESQVDTRLQAFAEMLRERAA